MQANVEWRLELEAGKIWRVLPAGDRLVVGAGGVRSDPYTAGYGLRDQLTAGGADDTEETIVIEGDGSMHVRLSGVAPLKMLGSRLLGLRGEHEVVLCTLEGKVEGSVAPLDRRRPIRAVMNLGERMLAVASESLTIGAQELAKQCQCAVIDSSLHVCERFRADELLLQAASDRHVFGCEFRSSQVLRTDWHGQTEVIADLVQPDVNRVVEAWIAERDILYVKESPWSLFYDRVTDRLWASRQQGPHVVACIETDGRLAWCRAIHSGCCSGPVRRFGDALVVASGCGGVVTWLSDDGKIMHQTGDKSRRGILDAIYPTEVQPGPGEDVLALRSGKLLICCSPDGREESIWTAESDTIHNVAWWPQLDSAICWSGSSLLRVFISVPPTGPGGMQN